MREGGRYTPPPPPPTARRRHLQVRPTPGFVLKAFTAADEKVFINVCASDDVGKPAAAGREWKVPNCMGAPRLERHKGTQRQLRTVLL